MIEIDDSSQYGDILGNIRFDDDCYIICRKQYFGMSKRYIGVDVIRSYDGTFHVYLHRIPGNATHFLKDAAQEMLNKMYKNPNAYKIGKFY